jgi:hypothetical protein
VDLSVLFVYFIGVSIWSLPASWTSTVDISRRRPPEASLNFVPPLFGHEAIDGLEVSSFPAPGFFAIAAAGLVLACAVTVAWRRGRSEMASEIRMAA